MLAACVDGPEPAPLRQTIIGGTLDASDAAVVALVRRGRACDSTEIAPFCTGTLVSPRVVLTAAHCVRDYAYGSFEAFFGGDTTGDPQGKFIVLGKAKAHPSYDRSSKDFDIALLELSEPAPVAAAQLAQSPLDASATGTQVRAAGFGVTSATAQPDGKKRQGTMTVESLAQVTFKTVPGPAMTCAGDSGGPVFATIGGVEQLVGVTSAGDSACANFAVNARVDQFIADFILPFVDAAVNAPIGGSPTGAPADQLCSSACGGDADCPSLLTCQPGMPGQCAIEGFGTGNWGAACRTKADCGPDAFACGHLSAGDCRCFTPCVMLPPAPNGDPMPGGCSTLPGRRAEPPGAVLALLLMALLRVSVARRSASGSRR